MKRTITKQDLDSLTESQRANLRELWIPEKYDLAIAYLCTNAETDEYEQIEFVVGGIIINRTSITLIDIRHPTDEEKETTDDVAEPEVIDNTEASSFDEDFDEEQDEDFEFSDEDFEFAFERPTAFSKVDCLPLLSITQMIEIFERMGAKNSNYYITAVSDENSCELGNSGLSFEEYGNNNESNDLCSILWENLKLSL